MAKNVGWTSMGKETLDPKKQRRGDLKEAFNIGELTSHNPTPPLPEPLSEHEAEIRAFQTSCHQLCLKILRYIAVGLRIQAEDSADWFSGRHDQAKGPSGSILRFLYYPALPPTNEYDPATDIRAGAHSDYGSVTLLFQLPGQPGLEIQTPAGEWVAVSTDPLSPDRKTSSSSEPTPSPNSTPQTAMPVLANIGDLLSYWTNGLLRSTVHRVVFPKTADDERHDGSYISSDRYSIAYFCHPLNNAKLEPLPSEAVRKRADANPAEKRCLTAKDHLDERLAATYS